MITFFIYGGMDDIKGGFKSAKWLLPLMALFLILDDLSIFEALRIGQASLILPIYRMWTLWAVIFGGRIMHENHLLKRSFASLLMILGAIAILI